MLSAKERQLVQTLEVIRVEEFVAAPVGRWPGRPQRDRRLVARAFVAKAVYGFATTRALLDALASSPRLRRICGWERRHEVPSEASFSRTFAEMAHSELLQRVHAAMIETHQRRRLVGHLSRDAAAIAACEKATRKARDAPRVEKPKFKRGRPRKGEVRPAKELTRLQRQAAAPDLATMLADLPQVCDFGCKRNSDGKTQHWKGVQDPHRLGRRCDPDLVRAELGVAQRQSGSDPLGDNERITGGQPVRPHGRCLRRQGDPRVQREAWARPDHRRQPQAQRHPA